MTKSRGPVRQSRNFLTYLLAAFLLLFMGNCAALQKPKEPKTYQELEISLGQQRGLHIFVDTERVLLEYGYYMTVRRVASHRILIESAWQKRAPFVDEAQAGISTVETRLIIRAGQWKPTRLNTAGPIRNLRPVWLVAINRFPVPGDSSATPAISEEFKAYVDQIGQDLLEIYSLHMWP